MGALRLDPALYEEVEHDDSELLHAIAVVALAAVASAIGSLGWAGPSAFAPLLAAGYLSWLLWTTLCWLIGVRVLEHRSDFAELLRTVGFVSAPQLLYVLLRIPVPIW